LPQSDSELLCLTKMDTELVDGLLGMLAGKAAADPRAVWHSRVGLAADNRASKVPVKARKQSTAKLPDFIAPELCQSVERPPNGPGLGARDQVRRLPHPDAHRQ
jgi:hypothetical protein